MTTAKTINQELYDRFWETCGDFSRYNPGSRHRRRKLGALVDKLPFGSVLDVGCGNAENILWLRARVGSNVSIAGVDLSPETVQRNARRHTFARFSVLDIERESLDEQFDLVICTEVIEHLEDQARAVENLAHMVSPGGHLVLTCPTGRVHETERHFGHVAHPSIARLRSMLVAAGLEVVSLENWGFPLYVALKYATNFRSSWSLKNFGTTEYRPMAKALCHALYLANFANLSASPFGAQLFASARKV